MPGTLNQDPLDAMLHGASPEEAATHRPEILEDLRLAATLRASWRDVEPSPAFVRRVAGALGSPKVPGCRPYVNLYIAPVAAAMLATVIVGAIRVQHAYAGRFCIGVPQPSPTSTSAPLAIPEPEKLSTVAFAAQHSPLVTVNEAVQTPALPAVSLPTMWVMYGRSSNNRPVAVWVWQADGTSHSAYVYLEGQYGSGGSAVDKVVAAGLVPGQPVEALVQLVDPEDPKWYIPLAGSDQPAYVLVDMKTGSIIRPK